MQGRAGGGEGEEEGRSRPAVCRRLFADDPGDQPAAGFEQDNLLNQISEQINRDLDDACRKYNFDFRHELPMEGNWLWERVTGDEQLSGPPRAPPGPTQQPQGPPAPQENALPQSDK